MSIATYGAQADQSTKATPPARCISAAIAWYGVKTPVTLEQAEKAPILTGRSRYWWSSPLSAARSTTPCGSGGTTTTSAIVSYHDVWFEWCSRWVTNTTGRSTAGSRTKRRNASGALSPRIRCNLFTIPVMPEAPVTIRSSGPALTCALRMRWASWYASVIAVPVSLASEWVLPTKGPNRSTRRDSIGRYSRPLAVQSA